MRGWPQQLIAILVLVIAVMIGLRGHAADPTQPAATDTIAPHDELAVAPMAVIPPAASPTAAPTPPPTAAPPTVAPTLPPAPTPTPGPTAVPTLAQSSHVRPPLPENTTGQSIIIERGQPGRMQVALTFDAGEEPGATTEILDFLRDNGIHASFGITGAWVEDHPELVQRMVNEGHMLFSHSDTHLDWTGDSAGTGRLPDDQRTLQVTEAERKIVEATGYNPAPFWRPPYGEIDGDGLTLLYNLGYDYTLWWTCDSLGWAGATPDEIVERCGPDAEGGGDGAIILMHVSQFADYESLSRLVPAYEEAGYHFVTMDEMIQP